MFSHASEACPSDNFLHPRQIVVATELHSATTEGADEAVAHALVEAHAILREILVLLFGVGDAGVEIGDALCCEGSFERIIELTSETVSAKVFGDVDARLDADVEGGAWFERGSIGISYDETVVFCDEVGKFFHDSIDTTFEVFYRWNRAFVRHGGVFDVVGVDGKNRFGVCGRCGSDGDIHGEQ